MPKFWHSISSDAELLDEELEEEVEETTTHHEPYPFFEEESTQVNETTQLGSDVNLHCRVQNLGEKIVSAKVNKRKEIFFSTQLTRVRFDWLMWFRFLLEGIMGATQRRSAAFDYVRRLAVQQWFTLLTQIQVAEWLAAAHPVRKRARRRPVRMVTKQKKLLKWLRQFCLITLFPIPLPFAAR